MSYNSNNYTKFEYPIGINKTDWIYAQDTLNLNFLKQIFNKLSKNYTNLNVTPTIMMINNDKNFSNNTNMNIKNDYMMFDSNRMFLIIFFLLLLLMLTISCCLAIAYCIHKIYQKLKQRRCSYTLVHDNNFTLNNTDTNADYSNLNDCFTSNNNTGIQFHKEQLTTSDSFVHSIFNNEQSDTLLKRWHQLQEDKIQCQHNDVNQIKKEDIEYQLKELELQEEVQYKLLEKLLEKPFKKQVDIKPLYLIEFLKYYEQNEQRKYNELLKELEKFKSEGQSNQSDQKLSVNPTTTRQRSSYSRLLLPPIRNTDEIDNDRREPNENKTNDSYIRILFEKEEIQCLNMETTFPIVHSRSSFFFTSNNKRHNSTKTCRHEICVF
ncbi:unnamed protein product [Rotaria magnacalcarata]